MDIVIYVVLFIVWNAAGFYAGVLMVTDDRDFTGGDIVFAAWMGLGGPIMLLALFLTEWSERHKDKVIAKKRGDE